MKVAILTDSNSGISKKEAEELGVHIIPMPVIIDNQVYFENTTITESQFYSMLKSGKNVSTSQPSPGDVMSVWDSLLTEYDQIVYIPMSSGLSSSCSTATSLALDYDGRVAVVNNHRISVTLRVSVLTAVEMSNNGKDAFEIKQFLEKDAYNSSIYVSVNTLEYLKKGGRISSVSALVGGVLSIKPILTIQGEKLDPFDKVRGSILKCEEKMLQAIKKDVESRFSSVAPEDLYIGAAGAFLDENDRKNWLDLVSFEFPGSKIFYGPLSASIGCHTGPGAVGIGVSVH